jgi:hypothetical protein
MAKGRVIVSSASVLLDFINSSTNEDSIVKSLCKSIADSANTDVFDYGLFCTQLESLRDEILNDFAIKCKKFDTANSEDCLDKKYSVNITPSDIDYLRIAAFVVASFCKLEYMHNNSLDYHASSLRRDISFVLARFVFLHNGNIVVESLNGSSRNSTVFQDIFSCSVACLSCMSIKPDEVNLFRVLILNLLDELKCKDRRQVLMLLNRDIEYLSIDSLAPIDTTLSIVKSSISAYYEFVSSDSSVKEIDTSWLYAIIYKKRFGFLLGKKFLQRSKSATLPYRFHVFSPAFVNSAGLSVANATKVRLFEAGEMKRNSKYIPID